MRDDPVVQLLDPKLVFDLVPRALVAHGICEIVVNRRVPLKKLASTLRHTEPCRPPILSVLQEVSCKFLLQGLG